MGNMAEGQFPNETNPTNTGVSQIRTNNLEVCSAVL